jgi:micrococcal nuclease
LILRKKKFTFRIMKKALLVFLFIVPFAVQAQLVGKVISIADGDTFTMLVNNKQIKIRLHGIDCPEKSQDFGQVAKKFLSDLVYGKIVSVKETDIDRYGRTIGIVSIDSVVANEELLKAGLAWHYKRYDDNQTWAKWESKAKIEKRGLWIMDNMIPPWEWRATQKLK